jgi:succinyl-CoA synthetase alpha subunit
LSILVDEKTKVIVQGITGRDGSFHAKTMIDYGTKVVAGATPGKGGTECVGVPVFDSVREARDATGADTSIAYVPYSFAADAVHEAFDAGIELVVCITEGIPTSDVMRIYGKMKSLGVRMIGPNCPGIISPGKCKVGIMPAQIHTRGNVGVVSRSGTLTYEVVNQLTKAGLGQSTCIGIGGDPIIGTNFIDTLKLFQADPETKAIVLIGEIGGTDEEEAAEFIKSEIRKPVVGFVAGQTAPPGKRMGHAGAIVSGGTGTAAEKVAAFKKSGIAVADIPSQISGLVASLLK